MDVGWQFGRASVVTRLHDVAGDAACPERPAEGTGDGKYAVEATIGEGGMGQVLLVRDRDLRRRVAMKLMKEPPVGTAQARFRFVAEAQATSQLEHPGIPPVHDLGITDDGRPYFTMKLVRGRTLREVLHDLLLGRRDVRREYSLHRLVTVMERICEAVHFAHEQGVIHCDLKPENVMLGDYGEVHVMDWGIARVGHEGVPTEDRIATERTDAGLRTVEGAIRGTVPYMSPEQAAGQTREVDRRSDVYALGCVLYEMLTLHMAFPGPDAHARVLRGEFPPVRTVNPRRPVPEPLADLCDRAMERERDARPATARDLGAALRAWLDGSADRDRRRSEADALADRGRRAVESHRACREAIAAAEADVDRIAATFKPWQAMAEKRPLLAARAALAARRADAAESFAEANRLLDAALVADDGHAEARRLLAELWIARVSEAERAGDGEEAARALRALERRGGPAVAEFVRGDGSLALATDPPGAQATLHALAEEDGVLVPGRGRDLGRTPIGPVPLPMGTYLCLLRAADGVEIRYPVHVTRRRSWTGLVVEPPDRAAEEFVFVPGGPAILGQGRSARVADVGPFRIQRMPVTFSDYGRFLDALEAREGPAAAEERAPGTAGDGPFMERAGDGRWRVKATLVDEPARGRCVREFGADFQDRVPVLGVSHADAAAYAAWRAAETGLPWRLPTEEEREKAARGVDGRTFPWGETEDPSLGKCRDSRNEPAQPEPVGAFPTATSIYGMVDAAGGAWEWTDSWFDERKALRVLKGGAWGGAIGLLRCAARIGHDPSLRLAMTGFRCAMG